MSRQLPLSGLEVAISEAGAHNYWNGDSETTARCPGAPRGVLRWGQMVRPFAVAFLLLAATVAGSQPHLVLDHKIGTGWPLGSPRWMSFVAISSDGQTIVGDGGFPLADDRLAFWTFPDGRFLRNIDGTPAAISPDFRYVVLEKQILDLQSGKPILTVAREKDMLGAAAFSPDSLLVAVNASPHLVKGAQVTILRTTGGGVLSSFGTR